MEEEKAAEIKNQVQTVKNSPEAQQQQATTTESKKVAEMQQECRDSAQALSRKSVKTERKTHGTDMHK